MINEYDLTIFVQEDGELFRRYCETHYQRAYSLEMVKTLIEKAGMEYLQFMTLLRIINRSLIVKGFILWRENTAKRLFKTDGGIEMTDYIVHASGADNQVRIFAASTRDLVEKQERIHNTSPVATAALGRLLTAGAMMGSMMKGEKDLLDTSDPVQRSDWRAYSDC